MHRREDLARAVPRLVWNHLERDGLRLAEAKADALDGLIVRASPSFPLTAAASLAARREFSRVLGKRASTVQLVFKNGSEFDGSGLLLSLMGRPISFTDAVEIARAALAGSNPERRAPSPIWID